ncbi:GTP-binding protein ypt4 [Gaeumannomyces tritici R3-111a-1]|uniref:GTP-binding protein ypt4 n=1 Tax=Gaeumannomyces tritici (strain R3-111a-1) TaxID=644352 RepID=J3NSD2_GAET3|nr:GTP-binding protein ypt4 [Gaeumannomyces tritici R3-111a-1]EJT79089.1 GTP-binding protein ypt4 [Gaeumannomyces tritici R3-111a-1]
MSAPPWDYIAKLVCIGDSGCGKSSLTVRLSEGRFDAQPNVTIGLELGGRIVPVGPPHSRTLPPLSGAAAPASPMASSPKTEVRDGASTAAPGTPRNTARRGPPAAKPPAEEEGPQKHMKLSVWDTAGQETYRSVTQSYFRNASGALLVFDLSRRDTFQHATSWLEDLKRHAESDPVVILVGNKADLTRLDENGGAAAAATPAPLPKPPAPTSTITTGPLLTRDSNVSKSSNKREVTRDEAEAWVRAHSDNVIEYIETSAKSGENVELAFMRLAERIYQNIQAGKYNLNSRQSGVKVPGTLSGTRQVQMNVGDSRRGGYGCC